MIVVSFLNCYLKKKMFLIPSNIFLQYNEVFEHNSYRFKPIYIVNNSLRFSKSDCYHVPLAGDAIWKANLGKFPQTFRKSSIIAIFYFQEFVWSRAPALVSCQAPFTSAPLSCILVRSSSTWWTASEGSTTTSWSFTRSVVVIMRCVYYLTDVWVAYVQQWAAIHLVDWMWRIAWESAC